MSISPMIWFNERCRYRKSDTNVIYDCTGVDLKESVNVKNMIMI